MRRGIEQGPGVPRSAEGGVEQHPRRARGKKTDHLVDHDRPVVKGGRQDLPSLLNTTEVIEPADPQPLDQRAVGISPRSCGVEAGGEGDFHPASREAAHGPANPEDVVAR